VTRLDSERYDTYLCTDMYVASSSLQTQTLLHCSTITSSNSFENFSKKFSQRSSQKDKNIQRVHNTYIHTYIHKELTTLTLFVKNSRSSPPRSHKYLISSKFPCWQAIRRQDQPSCMRMNTSVRAGACSCRRKIHCVCVHNKSELGFPAIFEPKML
jgi:hypothetical protein